MNRYRDVLKRVHAGKALGDARHLKLRRRTHRDRTTSSPMTVTSTSPFMTMAMKGETPSKLNPFPSIVMKRRPNIVPTMLPAPPFRLAPPMTVAAMIVHETVLADHGCGCGADDCREDHRGDARHHAGNYVRRQLAAPGVNVGNASGLFVGPGQEHADRIACATARSRRPARLRGSSVLEPAGPESSRTACQ